MASFEKFLGAYTAYVSERPPFRSENDPAVDYWELFVNKLPEPAVEELCKAVRSAWQARGGGKPTLTDFQSMWARMRPKHGDLGPTEDCGLCAGTGFLPFVGTYLGRRQSEPTYAVGIKPRDQIDDAMGCVGTPCWCVTYCVCSYGQKLARQDDGAPHIGYSHEAKDWLLAARETVEREGLDVRTYGHKLIWAATGRDWDARWAEPEQTSAPEPAPTKPVADTPEQREHDTKAEQFVAENLESERQERIRAAMAAHYAKKRQLAPVEGA